MSEGSQTEGIVVSYDNMTPIPVISYDQTNNALVFNHQLQATKGVASSASETLEFKSLATFNNTIRVGYNGDFDDSVPMTPLFDPTSLIFPAINSVGTIQTTELMIANDGAMRLYAGHDGTHINGDITVDGNITNANLHDQLNLKALLHNPTCSRTIVGITPSRKKFS